MSIPSTTPAPAQAQRLTPQPPQFVRTWAWVYAGLFVFVVAIGYIPGFKDADGNLFGLFSLQWYDDALHLASGIWAAIAAWSSARASLLYFRLFGVVYLFDGVLGLMAGVGYLDAGIFICGPQALDLQTRFFANLPHLLIGGIAVLVGFVFSRARTAR
jgi:hypothetical protein